VFWGLWGGVGGGGLLGGVGGGDGNKGWG